MLETLSPTHTKELTHTGGFGNSETLRVLAFGKVVGEDRTELKIQGVRVRGAGGEFPHIIIERGGEHILVAVNPHDEDYLTSLREALSLY